MSNSEQTRRSYKLDNCTSAPLESGGAQLSSKSINMNLTSNTTDSPHDVQISAAFSSLQDAMTDYVEDLNRRLNAGLAVRRTQTTFEVHEFEKADALVSVSLN